MARPDPAAAPLRLSRQIDADATGTALLLSAPSAVALWPGARQVAEVGGRLLIESPAGAAAVRALPPRRTPTAFVSRFEWSGCGLPGGRAELVLTPVGGGLRRRTQVTLVIDPDRADNELAGLAGGFLDNLARAAEERAAAA